MFLRLIGERLEPHGPALDGCIPQLIDQRRWQVAELLQQRRSSDGVAVRERRVFTRRCLHVTHAETLTDEREQLILAVRFPYERIDTGFARLAFGVGQTARRDGDDRGLRPTLP